MSQIISGAKIVTPDQVLSGHSLEISNGLISRIIPDNQLDKGETNRTALEGLTLFPGFIDLHIHGASGVDVMDGSEEAIDRISKYLLTRGVTSWLPTLVPSTTEQYARTVDVLERYATGWADTAGARLVGMHYEGPFVNSAMCGALKAEHFRTYSSPRDLDGIVVPKGFRKMITVAPEIVGGVDLIRSLKSDGWVVSIGHTSASMDILEDARLAGAVHVTHLPNAMSPLHHREPGPIGWALVEDRVSCDFVADGKHSSSAMLQIIVRCKPADKLMLISDAIAPTGLGDGSYNVWGEKIAVKDGVTSNRAGKIAGSVISLPDAIKNMIKLGVSQRDVSLMVSTNPARLLGLTEFGAIKENCVADLVALDDNYNVRATFLYGKTVFRD
jgi:N-acetylglucosamine-6-phosphate deacetylase